MNLYLRSEISDELSFAVGQYHRQGAGQKADLRYQTAEEFAYELSRLEESLKRGMTEEFLAQSRLAINQKNWERARQRQAADEASATAGSLAEAGRSQEAMEALRDALLSDSDNSDLQMLLAIIKSEAETEKQEKEEQRNFIGAVAEESFSGIKARARQQDSELLLSVKKGLAQNLPMSALRPLAEPCPDLNQQKATAKEDEAISSVLNVFI